MMPNEKLSLIRHHPRIAGKVLSIDLNKKKTNFELSDFKRTSKKLRSNVIEIKIRDVQQYTFVGICISHKKDVYITNTSFLLRNTFDRIPYEAHFKLYSPYIDNISILHFVKKLIINHSRFFFLRTKSMPKSTVVFDYITDIYDHDCLHEEDLVLKEIEKPMSKMSNLLNSPLHS